MAAGTTIAIGFGARRRGRTGRSSRRLQDEEILRLAPLLDRIDGIESRMAHLESRPGAETSLAALTRLDLRVQLQAREVETLRLQINETTRRATAEQAFMKQRFAEVAAQIPAAVETAVVPRVDDLRVRLQSEMQQTLARTLGSLERSIAKKVGERISALERTLNEQSVAISCLARRAADEEAALKRLISAVERLCDRPMPGDLPFEAHLQEALSES